MADRIAEGFSAALIPNCAALTTALCFLIFHRALSNSEAERCLQPAGRAYLRENRFRFKIGAPSASLPTISWVAPGGSGLPAGTASPRAITPHSNLRLAALAFWGVVAGSREATEEPTFLTLVGLRVARAGAFRAGFAAVALLVRLTNCASSSKIPTTPFKQGRSRRTGASSHSAQAAQSL